MRLPNGFGNVSKLNGKRRYPWRARATYGWEITEKEDTGYTALTAYNNEPDIFIGLLDMYKKGHITLDDLFALRLPRTSPEKVIKNIENVDTTLGQIYNLWLEDKGKYGCGSKSDERKKLYIRTWESCKSIKHMLVGDINIVTLQQ